MLKVTKLALVASAALTLAACGDGNSTSSDSSESMAQYQVTVKNITNAQPFSPITVLLHDSGQFWQVGESASDAIELIAEAGDNSSLVVDSDVSSYNSSDGVLGYGQSVTVSVTQNSTANYLSLITMLVNTNDAFSGLNKIDISELAVNDSLSYSAGAYDAGTEDNSEAAGTIPGPADGGEGFNAARDDVDMVTMHPGVVSSDDGLSSSVLSYQHKFDNPVMSVTITRVQ